MSHILKSGTKVNWIDRYGIIACGIIVEDKGAESKHPKKTRRIAVNLERVNAKRADIAHIKTGKHNIPRYALTEGDYEIEAAPVVVSAAVAKQMADRATRLAAEAVEHEQKRQAAKEVSRKRREKKAAESPSQ